ncbi:MAG: alpha/beta hydrolase [Deltaproteobacteria bacterium]|nr:alpha/beta hydrolase [Deltaproteobacteria bacterium]
MTLALTLVWTANALAGDLPAKFDYLGPEMKYFTNKAGRELVYIDEGEKDWRTVLFFSGAGTSVQAFYLTEFAHTLRNDLKLRVISLGRNGFGQTGFVPGQTYQDYADDVKELLEHLKVDAFAGVAISGGGPFMAAVAESLPDKVLSLHFAAAYSYKEAGPLRICAALQQDREKFKSDLASWIKNPKVWWDLGKNTSIHKIPAFQDTANNEGAHAYFIRGQMADPAPVIHEYTMLCTIPAPQGPSVVTAPIFMYYGTADKSVVMGHAEFWKARFSRGQSQTLRVYQDEGHDVQYRHWDQVLFDLAGQGDGTLICPKGGKAALVGPDEAEKLVSGGKAALGLCMWQ